MSAPCEMPELRAVERGHPDDGLDAVVVDQERDQEQEGLAVAAQLRGTSRRSRVKATATALCPRRSSGLQRRGGSGTRRNSGIEKTSHHTAALTKDTRVAVPASGMPNQLRAAGSRAG